MKSCCLSLLLLLAVLLSMFPAAVFADAENLLNNGGFESLNSEGMPIGWLTKAYNTTEGITRLRVADEQAHSGQYSACVENGALNDARFVCTAAVEPNSMYRLSGYVLVEEMGVEGNGANISLEDFYCVSECFFSTGEQWQEICWYGETGPKQTELTFSVRVGGYSNESVGKAYFDDISLCKVDVLPDDMVATLWYRDTPAPQSAAKAEEPKPQTALLTVLACVSLLLPAGIFFFGKKEGKYISCLFGILLLLGAGLRAWLAVRVPGYAVDIGCFQAWSSRMAAVGPAAFYTDGYFCDYPPGMLLLLWPIGKLLAIPDLSASVGMLLIKALPLLCDALGALMLYGCTVKKAGKNRALCLATLYFLNPAVLVNGAAWGQVDSVLALLLLLAVLAALREKMDIAIPLYVVSVLVKPQALLVGPILAIWLVWYIVAAKRQGKRFSAVCRKVCIGVGLGIMAAAAVVLPFAISQPQPMAWLLSLYRDTLLSYDYVTVNTANLYYLLGCNWKPTDSRVSLWLLAVIPILAAAAVLLLRNRQRCPKRLAYGAVLAIMAASQTAMILLGVSYREYGYSWMAFWYLLILIYLLGSRKKGNLCFAAACVYIGLYIVGLKIHERYLFPALLFLLFGYLQTRDDRLLIPFLGFSATTFLNTAVVLNNSVVYGSSMGHLLEETLWLNCAIAIVNLCMFGYTVYLLVVGLKETTFRCPMMQARAAAPTEISPDAFRAGGCEKLNLRRLDYLMMGVVTAAYAILSLATLGSTAAPQTAWISTDAEEYVVLSLPQEEEFSLLYYGGVSRNDFSVSVSNDGENWSESYPCEMREGLCYRWLYVGLTLQDDNSTTYLANNPENIRWMQGKYIRIQAENAGLSLWETVARNRAGENVPLTFVTSQNGHPERLDNKNPPTNLVDEIDTCVGEPSWYNGTYFDEIYYARTAYEVLNGKTVYETTHPPLGKLLMAGSVALFGMTPFGWRFAGALLGVLMLPVLYLLAMQLTHKRQVAVIGMLAFAFDLMHFAQSRLATIDSFAVFFILLSYLFMIRYLQCDSITCEGGENNGLRDKGFRKKLLLLFWCGISMGLSIASKWTGLYSACGLAILFFGKPVFCLLKAQQAKRWLEKESDTADEADVLPIRLIAKFSAKRVVQTCLFCVLFFVAIPFAIYYLSFLPRLLANGSASLSRFIAAQQSMLSYHSQPGLGMDHPFYSPWWEWPLSLRPMWFVQDAYEPQGYASTILCFGNPWVFYIGAVAMVGVIVFAVIRIAVGRRSNIMTIAQANAYWQPLVLATVFLVQYLPWVLVPRGTYIYHYFASVPCIILATAVCIQYLTTKNRPLGLGIAVVYLLGAALFFIAFLPYASGFLTPTQWLDALKWFPRLYY